MRLVSDEQPTANIARRPPPEGLHTAIWEILDGCGFTVGALHVVFADGVVDAPEPGSRNDSKGLYGDPWSRISQVLWYLLAHDFITFDDDPVFEATQGRPSSDWTHPNADRLSAQIVKNLVDGGPNTVAGLCEALGAEANVICQKLSTLTTFECVRFANETTAVRAA